MNPEIKICNIASFEVAFSFENRLRIHELQRWHCKDLSVRIIAKSPSLRTI